MPDYAGIYRPNDRPNDRPKHPESFQTLGYEEARHQTPRSFLPLISSIQLFPRYFYH